jgi:hypothetical protein
MDRFFTSAFDSPINSDIPNIIAEFQENSDGIAASEVHLRCNHHANILTVMLDAKGNIFRDFTAVK